jgi:hypothetical protein
MGMGLGRAGDESKLSEASRAFRASHSRAEFEAAVRGLISLARQMITGQSKPMLEALSDEVEGAKVQHSAYLLPCLAVTLKWCVLMTCCVRAHRRCKPPPPLPLRLRLRLARPPPPSARPRLLPRPRAQPQPLPPPPQSPPLSPPQAVSIRSTQSRSRRPHRLQPHQHRRRRRPNAPPNRSPNRSQAPPPPPQRWTKMQRRWRRQRAAHALRSARARVWWRKCRKRRRRSSKREKNCSTLLRAVCMCMCVCVCVCVCVAGTFTVAHRLLVLRCMSCVQT